MCEPPEVRFLSLFVPDLPAATRRYAAVFGLEPTTALGAVPGAHPFAAAGPVVFNLGSVKLALYQCDMTATHPGDVGIGVQVASTSAVTARATEQNGRVFYGPQALDDHAGQLAVFVLPDRHFFEVISDPSPA